jgi:hypothetical protein
MANLASGDEVKLWVPFAKCLRKPIDPDDVVHALDELVASADKRT